MALNIENGQQETKPSEKESIQNAFRNFCQSLKDGLDDITALEVNTMIVSEIKGLKFDPEEAYISIYNIPTETEKREYEKLKPRKLEEQEYKNLTELEKQEYKKAGDVSRQTHYYKYYHYMEPWSKLWENTNIKDSLERTIERHMQLREKLKSVCNSVEIKIKVGKEEKTFSINFLPLPKPRLLGDEEIREKLSEEEFANKMKQVSSDSNALQQLTDKVKNEQTRLDIILENSKVLSELRKLNELKALLEGQQAVQSNIYDIIYAQTVIQIDGDILNRFDKRLFKDPEKDFLLSTHGKAVTSGEQNWHNLLKLIIDVVDNILDRFYP